MSSWTNSTVIEKACPKHSKRTCLFVGLLKSYDAKHIKEYSDCVLSALHASISIFGFTHFNKESWCVLQDMSIETEMKNKDVSLQALTKKHSIGLQACFELSMVTPQASVSHYLPASLFIVLVFIVHMYLFYLYL